MRIVFAPRQMLLLWLLMVAFWWAFAFFPPMNVSPEWLVAAKTACFGMLPNGLPSSSGWMLLILAPFSMLVFMLVVWSNEIERDLRQMLKSVRGRALFTILGSLLIFEGAWVFAEISKRFAVASVDFDALDNGSLPADYPRESRIAPEFKLIDQYGKTIQNKDLQGKVVFLTFAFAHCDTICPTLISQTKAALDQLPADQVAMVVVTLDPWRDTPSALPRLAKKWGLKEGSHILSGTPPEVTSMLDAYSIPWTRDQKTGMVTHPALSYVLDRQGKIAYTFNNAHPRWLAQSFYRLDKTKVPQ